MTDNTDLFAAVEAELNDATERARALIESTDARHFTVRPHPGSWSAAECIAHLSISSESFVPVLREAIAKVDGVAGRKSQPPSEDLIGRILRWFLEPPIRARVKTSAPFVPKAVRARAEALSEFMKHQKTLLDLLRQVRDAEASNVKIVSPFDQRIRYNVYSAFRIIAAHERRHLWQAEKALRDVRASIAA